MTSLRLLAVTAALLAAAPARADDLWSAVAVTAEQDRAQREYDRAMLDGDDAVTAAANTQIRDVRQRLVDRAIIAYELAARARPDDPEPHFRAATVLRDFLVECKPRHDVVCPPAITPAQAARMIEHWNMFERLAPGDPRIPEEILFERALQRTRLGTDADLIAASADYRKLLDARPNGDPSTVLGNLAETYMMLGDLDRAIETYRQTMAHGADLSQEFGLAVALDRDEQGTEARTIMAARGPAGLARFQLALLGNDIFFVPVGEEQYYLALGAESLGNPSEAIARWDEFIASGAHPQFAARARHNRDALLRNPPLRRLGRSRPTPRYRPPSP